MKLGKFGHTAEKGIYTGSKAVAWLSGSAIFLIMLLVTVDVFGRYVLRYPVKGVMDIEEMMLVVIAFCGMAYTQVVRGHVRIGLVISRLSSYKQAVLDSITAFLSAGIFALIGWNLASRAWGFMVSSESGPTTELLSIPHWPFILLAGICSLILCLLLLVDFYHSLANITRR